MRTALAPPLHTTPTHTHPQEQAWLEVAPKAGRKKKQARRRRTSDPVSSPSPHPIIAAHIYRPAPRSSSPPILAHLDLPFIHWCISSKRSTSGNIGPCFPPFAGPQGLRPPREVWHVPSPQGVSQHEQAGPGSSGAEAGGAAGAQGMHAPSLARYTSCSPRCHTSQSVVLSGEIYTHASLLP